MRLIMRDYNLCIFFLVVSCGYACLDLDDENTDLSAFVSDEQLNEAYHVVKKTQEYLPYSYTTDGCYARSLYMSMELAAKDIPSSALYLFGDLNYGKGLSWKYHTAPILTKSSNPNIDNSFIFDPSLFAEAVTVREWYRRVDLYAENTSPQSNTWQLYITEAGKPDVVAVENRPFYPIGARTPLQLENDLEKIFSSFDMIDSIAHQSPFLTSKIENDCRDLYIFLGMEIKHTEKHRKNKRIELVKRTKQLLEVLEAKQRLIVDKNPISCGGEAPRIAAQPVSSPKNIDNLAEWEMLDLIRKECGGVIYNYELFWEVVNSCDDLTKRILPIMDMTRKNEFEVLDYTQERCIYEHLQCGDNFESVVAEIARGNDYSPTSCEPLSARYQIHKCEDIATWFTLNANSSHLPIYSILCRQQELGCSK